MKNIWKWILGIVIVLAILSIPFVLHYAFGQYYGFGAARNFDGVRGPMMSGRGFEWDGGRMHDFRFGGGFDRMSRASRFMPFFGGFFLLGGLLKLAVFGALLYGAYWLGKRNARITMDPSPAPAVQPESTPKRGRKAA